MMVHAMLSAIGLWALNVPYWLAFGIFTGLVAVVPFFGTLASTLFFFFKQKMAYDFGLGIPAEPLFRSNDKPTISMSLSHCIHQTLNSKASTRFHSGGLQQS